MAFNEATGSGGRREGTGLVAAAKILLVSYGQRSILVYSCYSSPHFAEFEQ
jgi:hypothetical protein